MKFIISFLLTYLPYLLFAQNIDGLIPLPNKFEIKEGVFKLNDLKSISVNNDQLNQIAYYLQNELLHKKSISTYQKSTQGNIVLNLVKGSSKQNEESYTISITPENIVINAPSCKGIFYGAISILQMVMNTKNNAIKACKIIDEPAYSWRGFMLDESRHFFGKEKVKSILNWMAFYKLNTFHWHLTDEPAWRLAIQKYPNLGLIGGIGDYLNPNLPAQFYSQADINEIIAYAEARYINVIPEIDMPGHATAANRAYPQYSGGGSAAHPEFTFNPGNEATYTYLSQILKETNTLFPSKMIHLGGDEVSYGNEKWSTDPSIIKLKQQEKLIDDNAVERYFIKRMADSVYRLNAKVLIWDEMIDADLPTDKTIIFWWRHDKQTQLINALNKGYQTVLCPRLPMYFDFVQDSTHQYGRKWGKLYNPINEVYQFNPQDFTTSKKDKTQILGIQANLWTETVDSEKRLDFLLFPRIAALAEAAWTKPENKNYNIFTKNLSQHLTLYADAGLYFYNPLKPYFNPETPVKKRKPLNYKD